MMEQTLLLNIMLSFTYVCTGQYSYVNTTVTRRNHRSQFDCESCLQDIVQTSLVHTIGNQYIATKNVQELNEIFNDTSYEFHGEYTCQILLQNGRLLNGTTVTHNLPCRYFEFRYLFSMF